MNDVFRGWFKVCPCRVIFWLFLIAFIYLFVYLFVGLTCRTGRCLALVEELVATNYNTYKHMEICNICPCRGRKLTIQKYTNEEVINVDNICAWTLSGKDLKILGYHCIVASSLLWFACIPWLGPPIITAIHHIHGIIVGILLGSFSPHENHQKSAINISCFDHKFFIS